MNQISFLLILLLYLRSKLTKKTVFIFNLNTNPFELNKLLIAGIYNYYYYCFLVCIQFIWLVCFIIISIIIEEEEE